MKHAMIESCPIGKQPKKRRELVGLYDCSEEINFSYSWPEWQVIFQIFNSPLALKVSNTTKNL